MADIFELFKRIASGRSEPTGSPTHIVVGLGNPGDKYARTRHNAGFLAMDYIAEKYSLGKFRTRFKATVAEGVVDGRRVLFMKPQTYMNNSGEAVREAADFYKIAPERVVVISDDVNLAPGVVRIRESGSDGGQKGLASIILHMNSDKIPRMRVGVGAKPRPDYELADWVLGEIPAGDREAMFDAFARVAEALPLVLDGKFAEAASRYNGKPKSADNTAEAKPKTDGNTGDSDAKTACEERKTKDNAEQTSLPPGGRRHGEAVTEGECGTSDNSSLNVGNKTSDFPLAPSVACGDSSLPEGASTSADGSADDAKTKPKSADGGAKSGEDTDGGGE